MMRQGSGEGAAGAGGAGGPLVGGSPGGAPRMEAILRTALEVAEGMGYLHARGIVHGDLTGANILLQHNQVGPGSLPSPLSCIPFFPPCTSFLSCTPSWRGIVAALAHSFARACVRPQ